jgi:hypothetical protein
LQAASMRTAENVKLLKLWNKKWASLSIRLSLKSKR